MDISYPSQTLVQTIHLDRAFLRATMHRDMVAFDTPEGQSAVAEDFSPAGFATLTSKNTDYGLEARLGRSAGTFYHTADTATLNRVVDAECRVNGVFGVARWICQRLIDSY